MYLSTISNCKHGLNPCNFNCCYVLKSQIPPSSAELHHATNLCNTVTWICSNKWYIMTTSVGVKYRNNHHQSTFQYSIWPAQELIWVIIIHMTGVLPVDKVVQLHQVLEVCHIPHVHLYHFEICLLHPTINFCINSIHQYKC